MIVGEGESRDTVAALTITGIYDPSAEQYTILGNALLAALKKLEPDKKVSVELNSLASDGSKPVFIYQ